MKREIYWSSIEYSYRTEAEEFESLEGGFVYVFIKAFDVQEALSIILKEFKKGNLEIIQVEFIKPYEEDIEWETPEQTLHFLHLFNKAKDCDALIYDDFYAYENK